MKGSGKRDEVEIKQNYVFFSNPEIDANRTEKSGRIQCKQQFAHFGQQGQQCSSPTVLGNIANSSSTYNKHNSESFLVHQPIQPYPFTFISAVKRKLALAAYNETSKKAYTSSNANILETLNIQTIDSCSQESLYQTVQKMDFIQPLKVPDVKILPKTLDYSSKDSPNSRDATPLKTSATTPSQKLDKAPKNLERVHRKLDFTLSEGHSFLSSDDIEPLRAPDISISPSFSKQKEHTRDGSREKENRIKRMKKDESGVSRIEDISQECPKRGKNPKHLSCKDVADAKRSKTERSSSYLPKDSEFTSKKPKSKNFAISSLKKDDEKRLRSTSMHSTKMSRERSQESRGRTFSSESLTDRNLKTHDKNSTRDNSRVGTDSDASVLKYNDDYQILNALRHMEEQKQKSVMDTKSPKTLSRSLLPIQLKTSDIADKEQYKRILDRTKAASSKSQLRPGSSTSEILEDIENASDSNTNKIRSPCTESSTQSKNIKISEQSDLQHSVNVDPENLTEASFDHVDLDSDKISFRDDSYSKQEEFCDLVTPAINLTVRSKRRKQTTNESDTDTELKAPKHKPFRTAETPQSSGIAPLLHPTALHMQFQAELHLFDSYNESLRQVMDMEKCLYTVKHDREKELSQKQKFVNEEMKKSVSSIQAERDSIEPTTDTSPDEVIRGRVIEDDAKSRTDTTGHNAAALVDFRDELEIDSRKLNARLDMESKDTKPDVKVAEVQTQTANDIATQTDTRIARHTVADRLKQYPGITYERGDFGKSDIPEFSLGSLEQFEDLDHIEDISLPSKMRTMSEISLHETTSSIKTETGTEISISTRDFTCSFNKYLDLEMAQLIKDEKLMYDKIEMLFKSREKTLNDRTRKLVKLEEQKRALRDTGQDSRISSVKKKQRALLLKLQQEKDEMNRLKELHKIASQERKLMLQKQRNMFNPQMSTKNILTKLKRSADCQSPRRLSGPMKGYDIRSNSSMSSLVDSDKSQLDRSQIDMKLQLSDSSHRLEGKSLKSDLETSVPEKIDATKHRKYLSVLDGSSNSLNNLDQMNDYAGSFDTPQKLESKTRKFEEKMPNLKSNHLIRQKHMVPLAHSQIAESSEVLKITTQNVDNSENVKSESDTLVEELSKKSRPQSLESNAHISMQIRDKESGFPETIQGEMEPIHLRKSKASQVTEESLMNYKCSKKGDKVVSTEREGSKKSQHPHESKSGSKRKGTKSVKGKSTSNILTENILRLKCNNNEEITKSANKRTKTDSLTPNDNYQTSILEELDLNESQNSLQALVKHSRAVKDKNYKLLRDIASEHETKENILARNVMERSSDNRVNDSRRDDGDMHNLGNISTRSQVSTFTISRHSSGDSEKSFSRSVVIRSQDHRFKTSKKLEQALNAREAALTTRRNCVEDWIAWHTKLKAEESRVARMEQAAFKLVSTTANALPYNDTTMSSDTSDVEGRVEQLAEKLAQRRAEMSKLKREARRQAKQRLKALEANLLNQIKKYDTTIHEMRKKLETQKGSIKDSDRLAIESRSVSDFKVPEIPIKRIQEIYKSSDLLRSRSESDLIFSKCLREDAEKHASATDNYEKSTESVYKSPNSRDDKSSRLSKLSTSREIRTSQSPESGLRDARASSYDSSEKQSEASSDRESQIASRSQESIASEDATTLPPIPTTSDAEIPEAIINETKTNHSMSTDRDEISEAIQTAGIDGGSKLFSQKLESLQLNKNLNDDISTLENDLKALSEMMSHFSKKSDEKVKSGLLSTNKEDITTVDNSIKSTSKEISEIWSKSVRSEIIEEISNSTDDLEKSIPVQSKFSTEGLKSCEDIQADVTEVISTILPDQTSSQSKASEEIDFEARSKEILNVIEKSIILEHVKSPTSESMMHTSGLENSIMDTNTENEALSHDLNLLEDDIMSISKMISMRNKGKEYTDVGIDLPEIVYSPKHHESELEQQEFEDRVSEINVDISHEGQNKTEGNDGVNTDIVLEPLSTTKAQYTQESESAISVTLNDQMLLENQTYDDGIIVDKLNTTEEIVKSVPIDEEEPESIAEELSASEQDDLLYNESSVLSKKSNESSEQSDRTEDDRSNEPSLKNSVNENIEEFPENDVISIDKASADNDWTISDSFDVPKKSDEVNDEYESSIRPDGRTSIEQSELSIPIFGDESLEEERLNDKRATQNFTCDIEDVSMFIPRGESTTIGYKLEDSMINATKTDSRQTDELDDILDIIERESKQIEDSNRDQVPKREVTTENDTQTDLSRKIGIPIITSDRIIPRPSDLNTTAEVEPVLQKLTEILQGVERNIAMRRKSGSEANRESVSEIAETKVPIISSEPTSEPIYTSKIINLETPKLDEQGTEVESHVAGIIGINNNQEFPEDTLPQRIEIIEKSPEKVQPATKSLSQSNEELPITIDNARSSPIPEPLQESISKLPDKTFDILRDPEYEDISEESLEVSEILDRSESQRSTGLSKNCKIPEKYEVTQKSEDVLRILDEISQKSYGRTDVKKDQNSQHVNDVQISVQVFGSVSPGLTNKIVSTSSEEIKERAISTLEDNVKSGKIEIVSHDNRFNRDIDSLDDDEDKQRFSPKEQQDDGFRKQEHDGSSESSEGADTPRGVSEIEMDSPRDPNESRLDIDALDDDLLSVGEANKQQDDAKVDFPVASTNVTSEKDIEAMIDKLKASLEQPGLEVAELEAKLLRIEQLQIELEIKKLEAEEVSFYVREIPNKPPPPYTPPGGGRLATPQVSPTLPPAVVPSNVEELTAFTEKATVLIFNAKNSGEDITALQPPPEICELSKENNEIAKQDRRIYNTFLFDLCKETIAELYRSEYERPGPSWTKPNVKTKPAMKIPKTVDELNEYVSKEVATLFGFKTKLQRENMVMRWSRKRRDRVDELLAREAQAEEDEWTKFHHDELAVKNELTVAILDTLILETANVVKAVYAKKRKVAIA